MSAFPLERGFVRTSQLSPESSFYVAGDDRLYVAAYSSVASLTVRFSGYFLDARGDINQYAVDVLPTSDRALTSSVAFLGEGFLLSCIATIITGSANRGQCYVRARIQRGTGANLVPVAQLLGGYVTDDFSPSFPHGRVEGPLEGAGATRTITGSDPVAGQPVSETVPTGARWRVKSVRTTLVTDATVADRRSLLMYDESGARFLDAMMPFGQSASSSIGHCWAIGVNPVAGSTTDVGTTAIVDTILLSGWRFRTFTFNLAAGDNWSAPIFTVEEWIEA